MTRKNQAIEHVEGERTHAEIMVIISALMLTMLLAALDQTIVSTALPRIASELHGLNELSWVATAYLLTSAISTPLYGKISDLFGRKKIFQISILIFLLGSVLCGMSQNMFELIIFRGIQGLGAGGLMTLTIAIVGDIVSPRQRGRYMGYFGGVFAASSVIGPLLGGLFTDHLSWRWIFYINVPLGALALYTIARKLDLPVHRTEHKIDFFGAGLLAVGVSGLLLATVWGGSKYAWASPQIFSLVATFIIATIAYIWHERRAAEPVVPLRLFKNDIFRVSVIMSMLSGVGMFGAIIFLPEYQQIVKGHSATESGLLMLPLVGGMLIAMITSGRLTTKYGKYRIFPIVGTLVMAFGFWLFSHVGVHTSDVVLGIWMAVLGLGMGSFMQVMTVATQNAVDRRDLGTATSVVMFFRNMGSALGAAIFGAILTSRLAQHLTETIPADSGVNITTHTLQSGLSQVKTMQPSILQGVLEAFARSFQDLFLIGILFALAAFVVALFLREKPLSHSTKDATPVTE